MLIKVLNVVFLIVMIVVNYLANALPINGKTTGEISAQYSNLFTPAGITFSIWGVIYLMLIAFAILQFKGEYKNIVSSIGWLFIISSVLNSLWIFSWHYQNLYFSVLIMLLLLVSLILINIKIEDISSYFVKAAFGIYLGWVAIATIANVTVLLVGLNWSGFGIPPETWTIALIVIGFLITTLSAHKLDNPFILLSVVWAFIGIAIRQHGNIAGIFWTAAVLSLVAAIAFISFIIKNKA